jgi:hypothetical protein
LHNRLKGNLVEVEADVLVADAERLEEFHVLRASC